jgi:hypothetical protein
MTELTKIYPYQRKILSGYPYYPCAYDNAEVQALGYYEQLRRSGFYVEGFCLTVNPPAQAYSFKELDARWKRGDKALLTMYEALLAALEGKDVFINAAGISLHPEFVETLPVFTVFQCFDDPENSHNLSRPVAASYDLCLVGNIAEVETYRSWGVRNVEWIPHGIYPEFENPSVTYDSILNCDRDINLFMMIDRRFPCRRSRMDAVYKAFPDEHFYGNGWPRGYLSAEKQLNYLSRAKIGLNVHNSTGPINIRTYYLPASGVLQICDNKSHLAGVFKLNEEVVGFDTIEEGIDLCRYYLDNESERRRIAANGWLRAVTDYNLISVFKRVETLINKYYFQKYTCNHINLSEYRNRTKGKRFLHLLSLPITTSLKQGGRCFNFLGSRITRYFDQ